MDTYVNNLISQSEGYAYDEEQTEEYNNIKMWAEVKLMISNNTWTNSEKKILETRAELHISMYSLQYRHTWTIINMKKMVGGGFAAAPHFLDMGMVHLWPVL